MTSKTIDLLPSSATASVKILMSAQQNAIPEQATTNPGSCTETQKTCERCQQIDWSDFFTRKEDLENQLRWKIDHVAQKASSCYFCDFLLKLVLMTFDHLDGLCDCDLVAEPYFRREGGDEWVPASRFFVERSLCALGEVYLTRLKHDLHVESQGHSIPTKKDLFKARVPQRFVDFNLLSFWLNRCLGLHLESCASDWTLNQDGSLRVIDVRANSVVKATQNCQFLALSYVWGDVQQPLLLKSNCDVLLEPGALDRIEPETPRTIRDAMELCRQLKENYLWVDSLCLLQDELNHNPNQVANMGLVYKAAKATIVASCSVNSNAGLPGVGSNPRLGRREDITIQGIKYTTALSMPTDAAQKSEWNQRGWTLQEQYLSSRILVFGEENVVLQRMLLG